MRLLFQGKGNHYYFKEILAFFVIATIA